MKIRIVVLLNVVLIGSIMIIDGVFANSFSLNDNTTITTISQLFDENINNPLQISTDKNNTC
jgi:hypothetical protein